MNLSEAFATARAEDRALLMPYMMAGIPDLASSVSLFEAMAEAGADAFEIGLPYADPLMDGPVIQTAGQLALANDTTVDRGMEIVSEVRERTGLPCLVMTYVNPVLAVGPAEFAAKVARAGAEAMIIADLPVDEAEMFSSAAAAEGVGLVLFAAPTTSNLRLEKVLAATPAFVYGIAEMGVTGERVSASRVATELAVRINQRSDLPLVLGVGISGPEQAHEAAKVADGVIVGSALVRRVLEAGDAIAAAASISEAVAALRAAVVR